MYLQAVNNPEEEAFPDLKPILKRAK